MSRQRRRRKNRGTLVGSKLAQITEAEREVIVENLIHDVAVLDSTSEAHAAEIYARFVADGRIDPQKRQAWHPGLAST